MNPDQNYGHAERIVHPADFGIVSCDTDIEIMDERGINGIFNCDGLLSPDNDGRQ